MKCSVEDCTDIAQKRRWCGKHYSRWHKTGSIELKPSRWAQCSKDGCKEFTGLKSGLCLTHYKQDWYLKKQGRTALIERTSQESWINVGSGYVMVKHNGRLTYEHIVLAEKALGKPLPKGAIVHHMNEDRQDNHTPFNLILCPSQEYHLLLHKRMKEFGYGQDS